MAEHCHGCNNDQCLGTATAQRLRADLARVKQELEAAELSQELTLKAETAYRSEIAPLRTRAEVDAEIAALTRQCVDDEWAGDDDYAKWEKITALCREPTAPKAEPFHHRVAEALGLMDGDNGRYLYADESGCLQEIRENRRDAENWREHRAAADSGPSSADAEEVPSPRPPASPAGAYLLDEPPIPSCSRCGKWMQVIRHHGGTLLGWTCACGAVTNHGPPGAVAAKESTDNAAAPEGAAKAECERCNGTGRDPYTNPVGLICAACNGTGDALEDVEACGCEETDALKRKLADIRTEFDLWFGCKKGAYDTVGAIGLILRGP